MTKKILLVDDDLYIRDLYAEVLKDENYDVLIASDGEEALAVAKAATPDLILLDIMLPKLDGIQVLSKIKEDPDLKTVPVVMLTNFGQEDLVKQAVNIGSTEYLLKYNITPGEIIKKVAEIFSHDEVKL